MRYLGLPLSTHSLKKTDCQFLVDKVAAKLPPWQGNKINSAGRSTLVKSVLTSLVIYHITALDVLPGTKESITKIQRAFLWAGTDQVSGGKCKVNWRTVCRPTNLGGLDILDLDKFTCVLRLRWLWFAWVDPQRAWVGLEIPCDDEDKYLFYAAMMITIGDSMTASYWHSPWLHGPKPKDIAPGIFALSKHTNSCVAKSLQNNDWVRHINL